VPRFVPVRYVRLSLDAYGPQSERARERP
jgi:hypothetical protein